MSTSFNLQYNNNFQAGPRSSQTAVQPQIIAPTANQKEVSELYISKQIYISTNKEEVKRFKTINRDTRIHIFNEMGWQRKRVFSIEEHKVLSIWNRFFINLISGEEVFRHDQIDKNSVAGVVVFPNQLEILCHYIECINKEKGGRSLGEILKNLKIQRQYYCEWAVQKVNALKEIHAATAEHINHYLSNFFNEEIIVFNVMGTVQLAIEEAKKCFNASLLPSTHSIPTHTIRTSADEDNQPTNNSHNINPVKVKNPLMEINAIINQGKVSDFSFYFNSEGNNIPAQQASISSEQVSSPSDAELFEVQANNPLRFEEFISPEVSSEKKASSQASSSADDFPWTASSNDEDANFLWLPTLEESWEGGFYHSSGQTRTQLSSDEPVSTLTSSDPMDVEVVNQPVVDSDNDWEQWLSVPPITSKTSSIPTQQASTLSAQAPPLPLDAQFFEFEDEHDSAEVSPEQQTSSQTSSPIGDLPWEESNNNADILLTPALEDLWG